MGCCASGNEGQLAISLSEQRGEKPIVVWGDITNAQVRTALSLLDRDGVQYQFNQVNSPFEEVDKGDMGEAYIEHGGADRINKRDYVGVGDKEQMNIKVDSRDIEIGEEDLLVDFIQKQKSNRIIKIRVEKDEDDEQ